MPKQKTFLVPVYIIVFSVLVGAAFEWPIVMSILKNKPSASDSFDNDLRKLFIGRLVNTAIVYIIMLAECLVYWMIREKRIRKDFAIGHAVAVALALVGIPVGFAITYNFIDLSIPSDETARTIQIMNALDSGLFKAFLIIAHICFTLLLMNVWKSRKEKLVEIAGGDEKDILNDHA